jgi:hypothetical protein
MNLLIEGCLAIYQQHPQSLPAQETCTLKPGQTGADYRYVKLFHFLFSQRDRRRIQNTHDCPIPSKLFALQSAWAKKRDPALTWISFA